MTNPLISLVGIGAIAIWVAFKKEARDCIRRVVHDLWQHLWPLNEEQLHPPPDADIESNPANLLNSPGSISSSSSPNINPRFSSLDSHIGAIESGLGSQMSGFNIGFNYGTHRVVITPSPRTPDRTIEMVPTHITRQMESPSISIAEQPKTSTSSTANTRKKLVDTMKKLRELDSSTSPDSKKEAASPTKLDSPLKENSKEEKIEDSPEINYQMNRLSSFDSISSGSGMFFDALEHSPRARMGSSGSGGGLCLTHSDPREDRSSVLGITPHELQSSHQTMNALGRISISTEESPLSLDQISIISSDS